MAQQLVSITCPQCGYIWQEEYQKLQEYRSIYRSVEPVENNKRSETYLLPCANPQHGGLVKITLEVED